MKKSGNEVKFCTRRKLPNGITITHADGTGYLLVSEHWSGSPWNQFDWYRSICTDDILLLCAMS